jgi:CheY-like chemotaxis protein
VDYDTVSLERYARPIQFAASPRSAYDFEDPEHFQSGRMARILFIDDDTDIRTLVLRELEAAGHEVRTASDGAQGMALQRALPADVVVTDIFMPEKEGIETIRDLRAEFPQTKIIAISGGGRLAARATRASSERSLDVVAAELGVAAVLRKPFEMHQLLSSIQSALEEH